MPSRKVPLITGEYYHVFNRGVMKIPIVKNVVDSKRFIKTMNYYQFSGPKPRYSLFDPKRTSLDDTKKLVTVLSYCLMPNHFHFLLKQEAENGISEFISKLTNSYTKYFNVKYNRVGHLFQGEFKAVRVESDEQLLHLSRYIHLNPVSSHVIKNINDYVWSSYPLYKSVDTNPFVNTQIILGFFRTPKLYEEFVNNQIDYAQELETIKHLTFEEKE